MKPAELWARSEPKLVAILRGITPAEITAHVEVLLAEGIRIIEVPMNSPQAPHSIAAALKTSTRLGIDDALIGAGTVVTREELQQALQAGARLVVAPNVDADILRTAAAAGAATLPGVMTPTEALAALADGATGLKLFPANIITPPGVAALRAILPPAVSLCAVGGITAADFADYRAVGVDAFGLGGSLYRPGDTAESVRLRARAAVHAFAELKS